MYLCMYVCIYIYIKCKYIYKSNQIKTTPEAMEQLEAQSCEESRPQWKSLRFHLSEWGHWCYVKYLGKYASWRKQRTYFTFVQIEISCFPEGFLEVRRVCEKARKYEQVLSSLALLANSIVQNLCSLIEITCNYLDHQQQLEWTTCVHWQDTSKHFPICCYQSGRCSHVFPTKYWLVVSIPLKNMKVNWDDYPQYMGK